MGQGVSSEQDPVEFTREHWASNEQPGAEYFAAMGAVMRAHALMVAELERVLKPHGLSRTAFLLMATLLMSREHTRPLGQLSRHLMVHPTTVTLVIDQLDGRGLVTRQPHPTDRRTVLASLTPDGLELVTKAGEDLAGTQFGLTGVSESLAQRLTSVLGQIRAKMGDLS
ncbi:MAG TPA: MarR family transcriptional regulator [Pseudonocardia sp.]